MANALYGLGRQAILAGKVDWTDDDNKILLIDTNDYTVSIDAHEFLSSVPAGAIEATSANLGTKTNVLGVADAADITWSTVTGDQCEAIIIVQDNNTLSRTTTRLIAYIDSATGLPVTPNGGDIEVQWNAGANKIFKL